MKLEKLLEELNKKPNGTLFTVLWEREVGLKKVYQDKYYVTKTVRSVVRKGIKYVNTKEYKQKIAQQYKNMTGIYPNTKELEEIVRQSRTELQWGKWLIPNLIIEHTNKNNEYNTYLRAYSSINKDTVSYSLNGQPISKKELIDSGMLLAKEYNEQKERSICFTLNTNDIRKIY